MRTTNLFGVTNVIRSFPTKTRYSFTSNLPIAFDPLSAKFVKSVSAENPISEFIFALTRKKNPSHARVVANSRKSGTYLYISALALYFARLTRQAMVKILLRGPPEVKKGNQLGLQKSLSILDPHRLIWATAKSNPKKCLHLRIHCSPLFRILFSRSHLLLRFWRKMRENLIHLMAKIHPPIPLSNFLIRR